MTETAFQRLTRGDGRIDHHHPPLLRVMMINPGPGAWCPTPQPGSKCSPPKGGAHFQPPAFLIDSNVPFATSLFGWFGTTTIPSQPGCLYTLCLRVRFALASSFHCSEWGEWGGLHGIRR